jgi:hypothetical protein
MARVDGNEFNLFPAELECAAMCIGPSSSAAQSVSDRCLHCGGEQGAAIIQDLQRQLSECKRKLLVAERELSELQDKCGGLTVCANGCEGDDSFASHWCRECDAAICRFCVATHRRQPHLASHVLSETEIRARTQASFKPCTLAVQAQATLLFQPEMPASCSSASSSTLPTACLSSACSPLLAPEQSDTRLGSNAIVLPVLQSVLPDSHLLTAENEIIGTRSIMCSGIMCSFTLCWLESHALRSAFYPEILVTELQGQGWQPINSVGSRCFHKFTASTDASTADKTSQWKVRVQLSSRAPLHI